MRRTDVRRDKNEAGGKRYAEAETTDKDKTSPREATNMWTIRSWANLDARPRAHLCSFVINDARNDICG